MNKYQFLGDRWLTVINSTLYNELERILLKLQSQIGEIVRFRVNKIVTSDFDETTRRIRLHLNNRKRLAEAVYLSRRKVHLDSKESNRNFHKTGNIHNYT